MFVSRAREAPSVVSTRVLKTHRMNSVENFRLQERVKTIDYESQHNCSQISDEIDGVRQNLVKIKGVKKYVGVSVERRKLLRDKGLRILPCKQEGEYFTLRSSNGKDVDISCSDFYDGETLRKHLNIDKYELISAPNLETENSDNEEPIDFSSAETRGRSQSLLKDFRYRNITPPLRPGSRRNFKDVDDENSDDDDKLLTLEDISSIERKYGVLRPQTAYTKKDNKKIINQRPRSRTFPGYIQENKAMTPHRKLSRKSSSAAGNVRKKSRVTDPGINETKTIEKSVEQQEETEPKMSSGEDKEHVVFEEKMSLQPSFRPKLRPRSMTVNSVTGNKGVSRTVADMRRMSLESSGSVSLPLTSSDGNWFHSKSPTTGSRAPTKSVVAANHTNKDNHEPGGDQRKLSKLSKRKVSWKDNVQTANDKEGNKITKRNCKLSDASMPPNGVLRRTSAHSQQNDVTRAQSAPQVRPGLTRRQSSMSRRVSKGNDAEDFVYDARPDKALSKGYMTMQMTIGGKQVKVYVPKFSTSDCIDDVTPAERSRAKSAVKAAGVVGRKVSAKGK